MNGIIGAAGGHRLFAAGNASLAAGAQLTAPPDAAIAAECRSHELFCGQGGVTVASLPSSGNSRARASDQSPFRVRGDTSSGGGKPATLETGAVVRVPLFVRTGEVIKVDTRTGEYVSRIKASS